LSDKKFFLLVVFFISIFCIGCCVTLANKEHERGHYFDSQKNINKALNSTVGLLSRDEKGNPAAVYCTAFFVSPTILITARHCIISEDERTVFLQLKKSLGKDAELLLEALDIGKQYYGREVEIVPYSSYASEIKNNNTKIAKVVHITAKRMGDSSDDIAILQLSDISIPSKHWLVLASKFPNIGEKVSTVGMPFQLPWIISNGMLSQMMWDWTKKSKVLSSYIVDILIAPGASGSPLLNSKGQVIGMAAFYIEETSMGLYAPLNTLTKYIQDAKAIIAKKKQAQILKAK
jgi:hypothetical protein